MSKPPENTTHKDLSPTFLALSQGKKHVPTEEQAAVISGELGPKLVTAGAGAGKTETMAARVVSLVANGYVRPEQVLGLTFTRKAAQQLEQRIRTQLVALREAHVAAPGSEVATALETIAPTVSTYDAYAGELVREYGLYVPVEPSARIITNAEHYVIAHDVVTNYGGELLEESTVGTVVDTVLKLASAIDNVLATEDDIAAHAQEFLAQVEQLPPARKGTEYSQSLLKKMNAQRLRCQYLPLVRALKEEQAARHVVTFGEQMSVAAKLARDFPLVGAAQRERYRVVMLDEYQDTSLAQRVLLRNLFGGGPRPGISVTAVGDPMQAIYSWRGATAENLAAFVGDFPQHDGADAPKDQLTTSWRNPVTVLEMANEVAGDVFASSVDDMGRVLPRPVDPLRPRGDAPQGEVKLGYFATEDEENQFVAAHMKEKYDEAMAQGKELSAAVLVRKNKDSHIIARALEAYGVPYEIVGLGGLLWEPEVQDMVAIATMLVRPQDSAAALRILTGPLCGLGARDIMALHERVTNLNGREEKRRDFAPDTAPEEILRQQLADLTEQTPDLVHGLADAVADLGETERYSARGLARIHELAAKLRHLRTYSLSKSLVDLFVDIENVFNIRTEVLARGSAGAATHLDKLADVIDAYHGSSLTGLLDYFESEREHDAGLDPGEVPVAKDRVLILTAHKAKGLEWEHVSVVRADSVTYSGKSASYINNIDQVPSVDDVIEVEPQVTKKGELKDPTRTDFDKACEKVKDRSREHSEQESARLFYVAITRTEKTLTVTGSGTNSYQGEHKSKKRPYKYLELLHDRFPETVVTWDPPEKPVDTTDQLEVQQGFPQLHPRSDAAAGAARVRAALANLPARSDGEVFDAWENEATALIEEYSALSAPVVEVELPAELTTSDMVALRKDKEQFARRQRRPVPFKPNTYAKRGTAFHAWLEERFGAAPLLGEDELPGIDESREVELSELKEKFLASAWAHRTPAYVEEGFEFTLGSVVVRGRMDAVFQQPDGSWLVIDWKTGRRPQGEDMQAATIQLAVYREAWARLRADGKPVRAAFFYVGDNYTFEPAELPDASQLATILSQAVH